MFNPFPLCYEDTLLLQEDGMPQLLHQGENPLARLENHDPPTRSGDTEPLRQKELLNGSAEEDPPETGREKREGRTGPHPTHPILFLYSRQGGMDPDHLHPVDEPRNLSAPSGRRANKEEGTGPFGNAEGCRSPQSPFLDLRSGLLSPLPFGPPSRGIRTTWRRPEVGEAAADGEPVPAIRAAQLALENPAIFDSMGKQDQPEARATTGTAEPVRKEEVH